MNNQRNVIKIIQPFPPTIITDFFFSYLRATQSNECLKGQMKEQLWTWCKRLRSLLFVQGLSTRGEAYGAHANVT